VPPCSEIKSRILVPKHVVGKIAFMPKGSRILIVGDNHQQHYLLTSYFEEKGYPTLALNDSTQVLDIIRNKQVDVALLGTHLPENDSLTLTRELRTFSDIGIILLAKQVDEIDRIVALELGADDYLEIKANPRELFARVKNLLRRVAQQTPHNKREEDWQIGRWRLRAYRRNLSSDNGNQVRLTEGEFQLLRLFVERPGRVLTRNQLLEQLCRRDWIPNDRTIDVLISRIRRKLEDDPSNPRHIITVHGAGYIFANT